MLVLSDKNSKTLLMSDGSKNKKYSFLFCWNYLIWSKYSSDVISEKFLFCQFVSSVIFLFLRFYLVYVFFLSHKIWDLLAAYLDKIIQFSNIWKHLYTYIETIFKTVKIKWKRWGDIFMFIFWLCLIMFIFKTVIFIVAVPAHVSHLIGNICLAYLQNMHWNKLSQFIYALIPGVANLTLVTFIGFVLNLITDKWQKTQV